MTILFMDLLCCYQNLHLIRQMFLLWWRFGQRISLILVSGRASRPFGVAAMNLMKALGLLPLKQFSMVVGSNRKLENLKQRLRFQQKKSGLHSVRGDRILKTAQQNILSMEKAITLARENAEATEKEILYLRQQLVIGESTLDSVLSAEARLYEAESKEINFLSDMRKSQLTVLATLGLLAPAFGQETEKK